MASWACFWRQLPLSPMPRALSPSSGDLFGIILGSFLDRFGIRHIFLIIWGSLWDHCGIILGSFLHLALFRDNFGLCWDHFESFLHLTQFWDQFGITVGLFWDYFCIWHNFGIILGSHWDHFGIILGSFLHLASFLL